MIQLSKVYLQEKHIQLPKPFKTATSTLTQKRVLIAQLDNYNGHTAHSECVVGDWVGYSQETIEDTIKLLENKLIPAIVDEDFTHPSQVHQCLLKLAPDQPMARATLEMGCWSLMAQFEDKPLDDYLGGNNKRLAVGKTISMQDSMSDLVSAVKNAQEDGYQRVKVKVNPENALVIAEILKQKSSVPIILDANESFSASDIEVLKALDKYKLMMIEQPFKRDEWKLSSDVQRLINTPICLDESIKILADVDKMVKMKAGKIITVKPACLGGFTPTLDIIDYCKKNHIPMWVGGMLETPLGKTYLAALASLNGFIYPGDLISDMEHPL